MTTLLAAQDEQLVNTTTLNDQSAPCIVKLADGYVVVWQSLQTPAGYDNPIRPPATTSTCSGTATPAWRWARRCG